MRFYRYRKAEYGLDELENNHIFFSDIESSNDPVGEGEITLYWEGDKIAWQGLLKNYICSFARYMDLYLIGVSLDDLRRYASMSDIKAYDDVPLGKILFSLREKFLHKEDILYLSKKLSESNEEISSEKLMLILLLVYGDAGKLAIDELSANLEYKQGFQNIFNEYGQIINQIRSNVGCDKKQIIDSFINTSEDVIRAYCQFIKDKSDILIGGTTDARKKAFFDLISKFPFNYVESLKNYIHPEAYMACFSTTPHDGQMWGNYAMSSTGVCIIYESILENNIETLPLYEPYGVSSTGTTWKYRNSPFQKVKYDNKVDKMNFFTSLGCFPAKQLESWLCSDTGEMSSCLKYVYAHIDEWRKNYWNIFTDRYHRKSLSWAHEEEYRLTIDNSFRSYVDKKKRFIHVDPKNIVGVILGPKMSEEYKYKYYSLAQKLKNKYPVFDIYQEYETDGHLYYRKIF